MLTIDMILALGEEELRARFTDNQLVECWCDAAQRLTTAAEGFAEVDSNLSALAAETVPASTGTAVDEIYDFESDLCCPLCGSADLVMRKGRWQCEPCEERIFQSGF